MSFFYNKGAYLHNRYALLREELRLRGINFNQASELDPDKVFERDVRLMGDYTPTSEAELIIRTRIAEKIAMKPSWYRWANRQGESL